MLLKKLPCTPRCFKAFTGTPLGSRPTTRVSYRTPLRVLAFEQKDEEQGKVPNAEARFVEQLRKQGIEKSNAQRILKIWKEAGSDNPEQLRKMFIQGSLRPLLFGFLQLVFDAGAAWASFVFSGMLANLPDVPFPFGISAIGTFVGFYFISGAAFDTATLFVIILSIARFGTNTESFIKALESIADEEKAGVLTKGRKTVDALKIIQALNEISDILREKGAGEITSLENLSAYLTLSHAEKNYGFKPEKYNLTESEAAKVAVVFSRYDQNDDGVLQITEIGNLCEELGTKLEDEKLEAAMKMLDTDESGVIEFDEFVDWWVNKVKPERADVI
eukprot:g3655.t1